MKNLVHTLVVLMLATSISAFAASKKPDAPKAPDANNAAVETNAVLCSADQQTTQEKSCVICQIQLEDSKEKAARQQLIKEQEKQWLKDLDYAR